MLELKQIKKDYVTSSETVHALRGIDITFRDHEFVSILGPSGCGKTTLLNIVGGLDGYTDGDLVINGRSTKSYKDRDWDVYRNHRVGFIFQSYNLIPHQTVLGNVELALTIAGIDREERVARAKRALDRVGLTGQYYKRPNQLSGGQCQRVAIARALVNDPEILLADEPTGALDTVTSVQIMNLIREIAGERLVIMVTHNPELAEEYSTRIVRLLDGNIIEDTNPVTEEELSALSSKPAEQNSEGEAEQADAQDGGAARATILGRKRSAPREKAKMSFITAFRLSARNLWSKRGRTALVGFAGSIGIIGIALVLAFSAGIKGYVASMQDDMLSGNPITVVETSFDLGAITGMMNAGQKQEILKNPNSVYISSLVEYLIETSDTFDDMRVENEITAEYIDYVKSMPKDYYNDLILGYGLDFSKTIFTDFKETSLSTSRHVSVKQLTDIYKSIISDTDYKDMAAMVDMLVPNFEQAPENTDYIFSQYELVGEGSRLATEKDEIMLVLNSDDELSDLLLARLGYYTEAEFIEVVNKASSKDEEGNYHYDKELYREYFTYEELLGKTLVWYPTDTLFDTEEVTVTIPGLGTSSTTTAPIYNSELDSAKEGGMTLKVVGLLTPKEGISYGMMTSGVYYTKALTDYAIAENAESAFVDFLIGNEENRESMLQFSYSYDYLPYDALDGDTVVEGATHKTNDKGSVFSLGSTREKMAAALGGNAMANSVKIYPISFDDKNLVTGYLDRWNEDVEKDADGVEREVIITLSDGRELTPEMRADITYTDTLELVINMVNTMIDIISYALIAFTSVSLVVSTVMIGIITYVSVVERIKEIGVIRSLGGRKRDVSHLFNAETFIIGLLAGLIGIIATYFISFIVNLILEPLINYANIAALPIGQAVLLVTLSIGLTLISGLIPASSAAKKDPVVALRTE